MMWRFNPSTKPDNAQAFESGYRLNSSSLAIIILAPGLFYQVSLMTWLLIAIIAAIVVIFILIAFILLPLSRRIMAGPKKSAPVEPLAEATISPNLVTDHTPDTVATQPDPELAQIAEPPFDPGATTPHLAPRREIEPTLPSLLSLPVVSTVAEPATTPISGQRPTGIGWQIAGLTDVGLKRELNEDNLLLIEGEMSEVGPYGLYIVADGLGGHEAGEVASQLTIDAIFQRHNQNPPTITAAPYEEWLKDAVLSANEAVLARQDGSSGSDGSQKMGSTLVMALVTGNSAHIVNVGDSRAYRLNRQGIEQISIDHSLVERLVQIGQITRDEARTHKQRNVVYSIIGEKRKLEIGFYHITLAPGDRLLLCSDGLSGMVSDDDLLRISKLEVNPAVACQIMVEAAKQAGGHDNITTIMIQIPQN